MKQSNFYSKNRALVIGCVILGCLTVSYSIGHIMNIDFIHGEDHKYKKIPENQKINYLSEDHQSQGTSTDIEKIRTAESKKAFLEAYKVFTHPRCMNCHPSGDIPLQGDDSRPHTMGVQRGMDGKGLFANKCSNCHQFEHLDGKRMPPASPHWHLPSMRRKMVFQGKSPRQLAASFKDSAFTGFHSVERIIEHVETDPLVKNSFTYGTKPPLTHEQFVEKVKEWVEKGAVLPDK